MLLAENPPLDGRSHEILTLSRFHPRSRLDTPNSPLVCGKAWTKGDGDTVEELTESYDEEKKKPENRKGVCRGNLELEFSR
jgi:hypothetical protein